MPSQPRPAQCSNIVDLKHSYLCKKQTIKTSNHSNNCSNSNKEKTNKQNKTTNKKEKQTNKNTLFSGVARVFRGGRVAHPESQNEEENEKSLRKNKKKWSKFGGKMRKVELLPTRDCEAGYGPDLICIVFSLLAFATSNNMLAHLYLYLLKLSLFSWCACLADYPFPHNGSEERSCSVKTALIQ